MQYNFCISDFIIWDTIQLIYTSMTMQEENMELHEEFDLK